MCLKCALRLLLITLHACADCGQMARLFGLFSRGSSGGLVYLLCLSPAPLELLCRPFPKSFPSSPFPRHSQTLKRESEGSENHREETEGKIKAFHFDPFREGFPARDKGMNTYVKKMMNGKGREERQEVSVLGMYKIVSPMQPHEIR